MYLSQAFQCPSINWLRGHPTNPNQNSQESRTYFTWYDPQNYQKTNKETASWTGFCRMPSWLVWPLVEKVSSGEKKTSCTRLAPRFTSVSPAISTEVSHLSTKHGPPCDCKPPPGVRAWKTRVGVTWVTWSTRFHLQLQEIRLATSFFSSHEFKLHRVIKKRDGICPFKTKPPTHGWYPSGSLTRNHLWFLRLLYHTSNNLDIRPHICTGYSWISTFHALQSLQVCCVASCCSCRLSPVKWSRYLDKKIVVSGHGISHVESSTTISAMPESIHLLLVLWQSDVRRFTAGRHDFSNCPFNGQINEKCGLQNPNRNKKWNEALGGIRRGVLNILICVESIFHTSPRLARGPRHKSRPSPRLAQWPAPQVSCSLPYHPKRHCWTIHQKGSKDIQTGSMRQLKSQSKLQNHQHKVQILRKLVAHSQKRCPWWANAKCTVGRQTWSKTSWCSCPMEVERFSVHITTKTQCLRQLQFGCRVPHTRSQDTMLYQQKSTTQPVETHEAVTRFPAHGHGCTSPLVPRQ